MVNNNIPPTTGAPKARTPKARGRSRDDSRSPKKDVPGHVDVDDGSTASSTKSGSLGTNSKEVRDKLLTVHDPVTCDFIVYDTVVGLDNDRDAACTISKHTVKGDDGAVCDVKVASLAVPMEPIEVNKNSLDTSAELFKDPYGDRGVILTFQTDSERAKSDYEKHIAGVNARSANEMGSKASDSEPDKLKFLERAGNYLKSYLKHYTKLEVNEKVVSSRKVAFMLPTKDEDGQTLVDKDKTYYDNIYINNDENGQPPGNASLKCKVLFVPGKFKTKDGKEYNKTTGYALVNVPIIGSEEWVKAAHDASSYDYKAEQDANDTAASMAAAYFAKMSM